MKNIYCKILALLVVLFVCFACNNKKADKRYLTTPIVSFDPNTLKLTSNESCKKVKGQVLYMPVYSNVPYFDASVKFDLSAFIAIHNTDLNNKITVTQVLFFDYTGKLVANYLPNDSVINPLSTVDFFISETDKSVTGANFLVEWVSDSLVTEPLIESVMLGISQGQGISFSSPGKIIRELK